MSEAPGPAVNPNAPQTCSTLLLPPQITPQGNQLPMIAATCCSRSLKMTM
jgi:hypothetical protein